MPIDNLIPDLYNNADTEFGENPLIFTQVIVQKQKYGQTDVRQMDRHFNILGLGSYHNVKFPKGLTGFLKLFRGTILAIFALQGTPMLPTKFQVNWPFGSGEVN